MLARSPKATWKYVLAADRKLPRSEQTVFELGHLTLAEEARLFDNLDRDSNGIPIRKDLGSERLNLLRVKLKGWTNFRSEDGSEIQFETTPLGLVKDDLLFRLTSDQRHEIALAIENEIVFDTDEQKKS